MKRLFLNSLMLVLLALIIPVYIHAQVIAFGTTLDPQTVMTKARDLAESLANPGSPQWQAKGDQHRSYYFQDANANVPYRICVPNSWDGTSELPLAMFLHGAGSDENSYLDSNNKQMVNLAAQHGYLLVSPLGYQGAYGTFLRLPAVFGQQAEADKLLAAITPESRRNNELSEQDVINVLEIILNEYPVNRTSMFLFGHSMGSGGTWYIGGKYSNYWNGLAPMSGPFVMETGYPWDDLRSMPLFVTEGTGATPSLAGSRVLRDWLASNGFNSEYLEVNGDHGGMIPLVLPDVFNFFNRNQNMSPQPTIVPTPTPTTNPDPIWSGGPYNLNGTSDYVDVPDGITNDLSDFSVACWVNVNTVSNWVRIFDFGVNTNVFMMLTPASGDTGYPYFCITTSGNSGEQGINGTSALPTGSWQHLAVVKSGNTGILYINTREVGRNTNISLNPSDLGNTTNNYIGRSQWSNDPYLNGRVDDFVIYNRALSVSEVSDLGSTPPDTTPEPTPAGMPGDTNQDGKVDIVDALLVAQHYVGLDPLNFNVAFADVDCSGVVNIIDALLIAQYYVDLITSLTC